MKKDYKVAVAGTGARDINRVNQEKLRYLKGFDGLSCPSKVLFVEKLQEVGNPEGYM